MRDDLILSRNELLERQVICRVLTTRQINPDLIPEYFESAERRLFDGIWEQWQKYGEIDVEMLRNENEITIQACLDADGTSSKAAIEDLRNHWIRRELARTIADIGDCPEPESAARIAQERIAGIIAGRRDSRYIHAEEVSKLIQVIDNSAKFQKKVAGYTIGLPRFDSAIGGIEPGKFYVLAALKKTGKSRLMLHAALKLREAGAGVMLNSLEMNATQLNTLAVASISGVNSQNFGGMLRQDELNKIAMAWGQVHDLNWLIYREYEMSNLKSRLLHERHTNKIDVVFVDFIQRMRSPRFRGDRTREVEEISQNLADMSREQNVAVIALSQLSGAAEHLKPDEIPDMRHIKESQAVSENADAIIIMHNPKRHETPLNEKGEYVPQDFKFRVEQRYGFSGVQFDITGDMRICRFWEEEF